MSAITSKKWIFMGISLVLVLVSIASLLLQGFNLDTDFAGGMAVTYEINEEFTVADVQKNSKQHFRKRPESSSVQQSGNEVIIKFGFDNALTTDEER